MPVKEIYVTFKNGDSIRYTNIATYCDPEFIGKWFYIAFKDNSMIFIKEEDIFSIQIEKEALDGSERED